jgi:hypothetical protein
VSEPLARALLIPAAWAVAGVLLWWGRLPGPWRRAIALVGSGAGLVFLFLALNTAGAREATTTGAFLLGPGYVTGKAQASASLPYYVMTGVCLLLGTAGLAVPNPIARRLADHWLATAILLSLAVTVVRFLLEQAAAPPLWIWIMGLFALAPVIGAFFAWNLDRAGQGLRRLVWALLAYGFAVRAWVAALYVTATALHLGSHFDLSEVVRLRNPLDGTIHVFAPASFAQLVNLAILPQFLFWPLYTLVAGLLGAGVFHLTLRKRPGSWRSPVQVSASGIGGRA